MSKLGAALAPAIVLAASGPMIYSSAATPTALATIIANDNRVPAGLMKSGMLEVQLDVRRGDWRPYGASGPALPILAFGEVGKPPQTPGPMIRVKVGTRIHARVTNSQATTLVVHGLSERRPAIMDTLVVPAGATREVTFTAGEQGTFYYWGSTTGAKFNARVIEDLQLNGALIVDPASGAIHSDRVFVLQWYIPRMLPDGTPDGANWFFTFNGMPWPNTERLTYSQGDSVHWRFINAMSDQHPLHLHGFYFRVNARGDLQRDTVYWTGQQRMGVTELMDDGTTMDLSWLADRPGGWIFHCHLNFHVLPNPTLGDSIKSLPARLAEILAAPDMSVMQQGHAMDHHAEKGMGGLVMAIAIKPSASWHAYTGARERLRLYIQTDSQPTDSVRRFGYALARGNDVPPANAIQWPGPPIILHKGQPTSIWVINRAAEPSQVHWHGLEIDSYYDGVAGVSRNDAMVSPMIMPRDSFEVTLRPPRAGSFMYHTHINDVRQQSGGLYGPIVVLDSNQNWDPEHDVIFQSGTDPQDNPIINGGASPPALTLRVGTPYRFRLMNITLDVPFNELWLTGPDGSNDQWTPLAKDGYDLPVWQTEPRASRQRVSIGETYDFQVRLAAPGDYVVEGRRGNGFVYARQVLHVVK